MIGLIIICGLGIVTMLSQIFGFKKLLFPIVIAGIAAAIGTNIFEWSNPVSIPYFDNMISFEKHSLVFSSVLLLTALFWFVVADPYFRKGTHKVDHYALVLFSLTGALMLTAFTNMATLFLGIEILSIPLYILAGSQKNDMKSNEAGFKYFIMGSFISGFLLMGITLVYGATGSFDLQEIKTFIELNSGNLPMFFYVGVIFLLIVLMFKVSVAPFHFWAPDVYEGSPTLITAYMGTIVKTAAFAAFLKLFLLVFVDVNEIWVNTIAGVVALSLIISNISAGVQTSVKRMLAYSSISQAAFMLMVVLANNTFNMSVDALVYYSLAYSLASIISFGILYYVSNDENENFDAFNGLFKRNPLLAVSMTISMLSLAGIPVSAGFFAKYFVLSTLFSGSFLWLTILAILASAVAAFYYLRIVNAMITGKSLIETPIEVGLGPKIVFVLSALLILGLGIAPEVLTQLFHF